MHPEVRELLGSAITKAGSALQQHVGSTREQCLVYRKYGEGWQGECQERPSLTQIFGLGHRQLREVDADFLRAFREHHEDHTGMLGLAPTGSANTLPMPGHIIGQAMGVLWQRHGTFQPDPGAVEALVQEFSDFIDQPSVRLRFKAQLLNYRMEPAAIDLPDGLIIRRLSEREVSEIYGGPLWEVGIGPHGRGGLCEYVLEGYLDAPKVFGDLPTNPAPREHVRARLDKAVLALRTFKEGLVGYEQIRFRSVEFCPLPLPSYGYGDLHVPYGGYRISMDECEPLREHAVRIFACHEPAMEMACSRLADAQVRMRPHDRLVDAVIGLESLLLAGVRNEDRRGELKFRFSLHYAALFGTPQERHRAFRVAKDLYDLRSTIAHGGLPKDGHCRVGDDKLTLDNAAVRACEVVRRVVSRFLPDAAAAPYKQPHFWERAYFGLPPGDAT
jgi:hypothetical protein